MKVKDMAQLNVDSFTSIYPAWLTDDETVMFLTASGYVVIIDREDWPNVSSLSWAAWIQDKTNKYVRHTGCGSQKSFPLSHFILNIHGKKYLVDHINHNGFDNRKTNLRKCTPGQNMYNRRTFYGTSKYKGVHLRTDRTKEKKWRSRIQVNGKCVHLGYFATQEEAALAYNKAAKKHFGKFACLNHVN